MANTSQLPQDPPLPAYLPELDGLRGIAVVGVLLFHLKLPGCELGWSGVFLFFVISGFLITGILLDTRSSSRYFRNFYIRRALRIFPIYYALLCATLFACVLRQWPSSDAPWYILYAQNIVLGADNFKPNMPEWLNHTWSLAVEEQFYLLWPLVVFVLSRRMLVLLGLALCALACGARWYVSCRVGNAFLVFSQLLCVIDSLAVGALLSVLVRRKVFGRLILEKVGRLLVAVAGTLVIAVVVHTGYERYGSPLQYLVGSTVNLFLFALLAAFFGGVILVAVFGNTWFSHALRLYPLRRIGRISYGLYLYHYPVFHWTRSLMQRAGVAFDTVAAEAAFACLSLALTYLIAAVSYHLVESPLLALKHIVAPIELARGNSPSERQAATSIQAALIPTEVESTVQAIRSGS